MSHAARSPKEHCFEVECKSFKGVERFKYFGIALTNQNSIQKKLQADRNQGMLPIIRTKSIVFHFVIKKYED
jgi:hypothetical protein